MYIKNSEKQKPDFTKIRNRAFIYGLNCLGRQFFIDKVI